MESSDSALRLMMRERGELINWYSFGKMQRVYWFWMKIGRFAVELIASILWREIDEKPQKRQRSKIINSSYVLLHHVLGGLDGQSGAWGYVYVSRVRKVGRVGFISLSCCLRVFRAWACFTSEFKPEWWGNLQSMRKSKFKKYQFNLSGTAAWAQSRKR